MHCSSLFLLICLVILPAVSAAPDTGQYGLQQPDRAGLIAEYHFEGNAADSSGKGADGTLTGGTFVDGIWGKALSLDGSNNFVSINSTNITSEIHEFTVSTWIKVEKSPMEMGGVITRFCSDASYQVYYGMWYDGRYMPNTICMGKNEVNEYFKLVRERVEFNKWTYITTVISPQRGVQELYINGDLVKQVATYDGIRKGDMPIIIGAEIQAYQPYQTYTTYQTSYNRYYDYHESPTYRTQVYYRYFNGEIDEMQLYNRSLSATEVKKLYLSYLSPPPTSTVTSPPEQVSRNYLMGFEGLRFNADGQNTLELDLGKAQGAGASVTQYSDRIEVYQHGSPGVIMTFWGDRFDTSGEKIRGPVKTADFVTDPLEARITPGFVSGSVRAVLPVLTRQVVINNIINGKVSSDLSDKFRAVSANNNLEMDSVAYTFEVRKDSLLKTGPANVTLAIPAVYVGQHGGKESVHIARISDETGSAEIISTVYISTDSKGIMTFRGDSPNGSSIFGMITAKAAAIKKQQHPDITIEPFQKPAIATDIGMFAWLSGLMQQNLLLVIVIAAIAAALVYFGWWKRREYP